MMTSTHTKSAPRSRSLGHLIVRGLLVTSAALSLLGCSVNEESLKKWEGSEQGPRKLHAVATHEKYDKALRLSALEHIINIRSRHGQNIALPVFIEGFRDEQEDVAHPGAILALPEATRKEMIEALTPFLEEQMKRPPPVRKADGTRDADTSISAKDAAYALISQTPPVIANDAIKTRLQAAIVAWATADFENRLDAPQKYGMEQMFKAIGASSVKGLPGLINENSTKLDRITALVSDLGDAETKAKASAAIVNLAKSVDSPAWIAKKTPEVKESNDKAKIKVTDGQLAEQLKKYQDQELTKIFSAAKKVGGKPIADYLIGYAANKANSEDRRKAALAALEGHIDKGNADLLAKLTDIASDDSTPDSVRDLAFSRLGELPKADVIPRMYKFFENKKWKVRWVASSLVLKSITPKGIPEFMAHLPRGGKMAMQEFIAYGQQLQQMEPVTGEPKPEEAIQPYLAGKDGPSKLVALSYYYGGKKADLGKITPHENEATPVPHCEKEDECNWMCTVGKDDKEVKTVGDYAKFCIIPNLK